jgi:hypothetical protein
MSKYCDECRDCNKNKTCVAISSDCVTYDLNPTDVSTLKDKPCLTVQRTTEDIYNILKSLKDYQTINFTELKAACNKIDYTGFTTTITQNDLNKVYAKEFCKLITKFDNFNSTDIFNVDIRTIFNLKCFASTSDDCGNSKAVITFKDLIQAFINKTC